MMCGKNIDAKNGGNKDEKGKKDMALGGLTKIKVPFSNRVIDYDPMKRIGVGLSRLGTSQAVGVGAYAYALSKLNS